MEDQMTETKKSLVERLVPLMLLVVPLFFLPTTLNFFATNKQFVVLLFVIAPLIATAFQLNRKSVSVAQSPLNYPLMLLSGVVIVTMLVNQEARAEGLINRGSLLVMLSLWTYLITTTRNAKRIITSSLSALSLVGTILAILGIAQILGLHQLTFLPAWMQFKAFTPTGNILILAITLFITLSTTLSWALSTTNSKRKTTLFFSSGLQAAALIAYVSLMLPGQEFAITLLPLRASWSIMLDTFKTPRFLLTGVGIANFSSIFTQVKPLFLNATDLWNVTPQTASNEVLQLIITMGLGGLAAMAYVISKTLKALMPTTTTLPLKVGLTATILTLVIFPSNIINYTILFTLLGLAILASGTVTHRTIHLNTNNLAKSSAGVVLALSVYVLFLGSRVYVAENAMYRSQIALTQNDGATAYQQNLRAIQLMPAVTSYRISYSQINLSLAAAISQNENLSDQDRNQVTQLIQQAIRESRAATELRPSNAGVWQNLGNVYRQLINVAEGSEDFTDQYLSQAINLDPSNALLRIDYGGLYYQLSQVVEDDEQKIAFLNIAITQFQTAAQLRPSYANAHYNLAKALELGGNIPAAYQAMQNVVGNLEPDSTDYETSLAELEALRIQLPEDTTAAEGELSEQPSELSEPEPLPEPLDGGPIVLPEDEVAEESEESAIAPEPTPVPEL